MHEDRPRELVCIISRAFQLKRCLMHHNHMALEDGGPHGWLNGRHAGELRLHSILPLRQVQPLHYTGKCSLHGLRGEHVLEPHDLQNQQVVVHRAQVAHAAVHIAWRVRREGYLRQCLASRSARMPAVVKPWNLGDERVLKTGHGAEDPCASHRREVEQLLLEEGAVVEPVSHGISRRSTVQLVLSAVEIECAGVRNGVRALVRRLKLR